LPILVFRRELLDKERGVYRYDQLIVLQNTKSPAVLFEAGIIVNKAEELELASSKRQGLIGAAMLAPVSRYCNEFRTENPNPKP
jgi:N-acetylmuramoyl-L-alanine amidase